MIKYLLFLRPIVMLLTFIISSITTTSYSQSIGRNYILARTFTDSIGKSSLDSVYYYDGLGRLEQTILRNASLQGEDIITLSCHKEYDSSQLSVVRREDEVYYYDGLGRLEQTILRNASLQGEDIITLSCHKEYDSSQLSVVRREDEDGNATFEFTDKSGQLLLIRQILQASSGRQQMERQKNNRFTFSSQ